MAVAVVAVVELLCYFDCFRNVDLFGQGYVYILYPPINIYVHRFLLLLLG